MDKVSLEPQTLWIADHLAGAAQWEQDLEAGWCLSTWEHLVAQRWVEDDEAYEDVPAHQKQLALHVLRRYRRGNMYA